MHSPPQMGRVAPVAWWCAVCPLPRQGFVTGWVRGDARTVEEGMVDGEEVGGRV